MDIGIGRRRGEQKKEKFAFRCEEVTNPTAQRGGTDRKDIAYGGRKKTKMKGCSSSYTVPAKDLPIDTIRTFSKAPIQL